MQSLYPRAKWRPLSSIQSEPNIGVPRLLIWHTMVGYLGSTERMFRSRGYDGTESTFGLGGSWDGQRLNGVLYQWQSLTRQADAQSTGNAWATSIECSDGGDPTRPFTPMQISTSVELGLWWCKETGVPAIRATAYNGRGFGYHRMFPQWNPDSHSCPGDARAAQLEDIVWPEIARRLKSVTNPTPVPAHPWPAFPLNGVNFFGFSGIVKSHYLKTWQQQMRNRGWAIAADGLFGQQTERVTKQFQKEKGLGVDGRIGLHTWNKAWTSTVT